MKHLTIRKQSTFRVIAVCDGEEVDSWSEELDYDKVFNETWFQGYKACECCGEQVALFYTGEVAEQGRIFHCYAIVDADDVTETRLPNA
jgi:hypothetical protein